MHTLRQGIIHAYKTKGALTLFWVVFLLVLLVPFLYQNGSASFNVFSFTSLSFTKRVSLFLSSLFDVKSSFTTASIILVVLGTVLSALNATLLYSYMRVRGEVIMASGFYSGIGLILAFLGIGCASCGTAFLTFLLSFFGGATLLHLLPYGGQEIGYLGVIVLLFATYSLAKKTANPTVC